MTTEVNLDALEHTANPYRDLPESVRQYLTYKEWLWLSDEAKATLVQSHCEPDY